MKKNIICIAVLVVVVGLFGVRLSYSYNKSELKYNDTKESIMAYRNAISILETTKMGHEEDIYDSVKSYNDRLKKTKNNEVYRRVYNKIFPSKKEFDKNRKDSMTKIYALVKLYPEMKKDPTIKQAMINIDEDMDKLKELVDKHNRFTREYSELAKQLNHHLYSKITGNHLKEGYYKEIVFDKDIK